MVQLLMRSNLSGCKIYKDGEHVMDITEKDIEWMSKSALDTQEGGTHYKDMKIQPIEYAMANNLNACEFNILKYLSRHRNKNGAEDLRKAKHMIDLLILMEYEKGA